MKIRYGFGIVSQPGDFWYVSIFWQQPTTPTNEMMQIAHLPPNKIMGMAGSQGDYSFFGDFIKANIQYHTLRTGLEMSTKAAATFIRGEVRVYTLFVAYTVRKFYKLSCFFLISDGGKFTKEPSYGQPPCRRA